MRAVGWFVQQVSSGYTSMRQCRRVRRGRLAVQAADRDTKSAVRSFGEVGAWMSDNSAHALLHINVHGAWLQVRADGSAAAGRRCSGGRRMRRQRQASRTQLPPSCLRCRSSCINCSSRALRTPKLSRSCATSCWQAAWLWAWHASRSCSKGPACGEQRLQMSATKRWAAERLINHSWDQEPLLAGP